MTASPVRSSISPRSTERSPSSLPPSPDAPAPQRREWTFGQKLAAGVTLIIALAATIGVIGVQALRAYRETSDRVITVEAMDLVRTQRLRAENEAAGSALRGYLLTGSPAFLASIEKDGKDVDAELAQLERTLADPEAQALLASIAKAEAEWRAASGRVIALRQAPSSSREAVDAAFEAEVMPRRHDVTSRLDALAERQRLLLDQGRAEASEAADLAVWLLIGATLGLLVLAAGVAVVLTRKLSGQIGTAVAQVQSSSTELQAAANQQATGSREQSTAMAEITTTINELLATSRQIAASAQRVTHIASETADAARSGELTVGQADESLGAIRSQTNVIIEHMLELGRRSQQIGTVLEIVSELAEQTNILSINASIEAAGAGESGKRFAVVADEIRKLADRVGASTKEVRALIDDVRTAVNRTVMATETGSKAVDAGARRFADVASSLDLIASRVATTTEAAREIELSTKQQATAVEQVNVAISNVAQASRETEASSAETLQTASRLAGLSRELLKLIEPERRARS